MLIQVRAIANTLQRDLDPLSSLRRIAHHLRSSQGQLSQHRVDTGCVAPRIGNANCQQGRFLSLSGFAQPQFDQCEIESEHARPSAFTILGL